MLIQRLFWYAKICLFGADQFFQISLSVEQSSVQSGEILKVAPVASQEGVSQIDMAVNRLLEGGKASQNRVVLMFNLAVVLEKGNFVSCRLQAEAPLSLSEFILPGPPAGRLPSFVWSFCNRLRPASHRPLDSLETVLSPGLFPQILRKRRKEGVFPGNVAG